MALSDRLIFYKKPLQLIYAGQNYLTIFKRNGKDFNGVKTFDNTSILDPNHDTFQEVRRHLADLDTGLVMNSANFIFNIFSFEKIPWKQGVLKELVEWRVNKVFPENIDNYFHNFFHLKDRNILSVLLKKDYKDQLENLFKESNINLIYFGNSTLEIIKNLRRIKPRPEIFFEIDGSLCTVVFQRDGSPYYIRKFWSEDEANLLMEVSKTFDFVCKTYPPDPQTFSLISNQDNDKLIRDKLLAMNLKAISINQPQRMCLPC